MKNTYNLEKNRRKHENRRMKRELYIISVCGTLEEYHKERCFVSAYGFEARPTWLPDDLIPAHVLSCKS
jgi:hypothetical protein